MLDTSEGAGDLRDILAQARALVESERDFTANAANLAALIFMCVPRLNWAGFYVARGSELVLGPFQGKPACVRIPFGSGVCGTAAAKRETIVVPDVNTFSGHIACDPNSRSEIVVPLLSGERLLGVLDVDSPIEARFGTVERELFEALAHLLTDSSDNLA